MGSNRDEKEMKQELLDVFVSILDSPLYKPFLIYFYIIATSFIVPKEIVFDDESSLAIKSILIWGASFFLIGWFVGSWSKR